MMAFVKSLNSGLKPVIVNLTNRFRVAVRLSLRVSPWGGGGGGEGECVTDVLSTF